MALFGRRAPQPDDQAQPRPKAALRVLRAAGQRIDLTARDTPTRLTATKQSWQTTALAYRKMIGELRYAQRLRAQAVAQARFYVAAVQDWPAGPIALTDPDHGIDPQLAADALTNFARIPFDSEPDGYTARFDENMGAVGEVWIHIDEDDQFHIRSISEVTVGISGIAIATLPGGQGSRALNPATESLLRCWRPDLEYGELADAPMSSLLDVAEDVVLSGRELRAASRSRVAANGILLLSSAMSMVQTRDPDDEDGFDDTVTSDTFMADFTAAMLAPLDDDGSAQQVVPLVLRGDIEDINAVKHITLQRADAEKLIERQRAALLRLLHSLDIQPEQVEGLGSSNHWCVDDETEVLSTRGWLHQHELVEGDVVLTVNHDTGLSEWQPVLDIYRADVADEPMILMDGRTHSSLTTPDHKWPTTRKRQQNFERFTAREFTLTRDLGVQHHIPTAAACADQPSTAKYDDDLVELVAWFWTEGNINQRGSGGSIAQSHTRNPDRVARIRAALTRLFGAGSMSLRNLGRPGWREAIQPNHSSFGGPITVFYLNRDALAALVDVAPGKMVRPDFVRALTPAQLELFIHVSCMGDGWHYRHTKRGGQLDIWQRDPAALEAFELALILSGRAIHRGESSGGHYVASLRSGSVRPVKAFSERTSGRNPGALTITEERYTGTIWCPVTANHTWFARRRGTAYFTGNTGWIIDARSIKTEVQPAANVVAACHMKAWLRPALESLGYTAADIAKITIVADCSDLAENPNRGQDARDAWDRFAISDEALRRELGFDEEDEPEPEEFVRRLAALGKLPVAETAEVLGLRRQDQPQPQTVAGEVMPSNALPSGDRPAAQPGQSIPEQPTPTMPTTAPNPAAGPPSPITAAAGLDDGPDEFGMHVDDDACRALAAIDAALAERIGVAADAALNRVLERAGARVRSAAQKDRSLVAQLANLDPAAIPAALGRDKVEAFVPVADLIGDEYTRLRGQVIGWLRDAAVQAGLAACDVVGLNPNGAAGQRLSAAVTSQLSGHVDPAWRLLLEELHEAAEWALFEPATPDDEPGEHTGSPLSAQDIADVIAVAGGDRPSIIASAGAAVGEFASRDDKGKRRRHRRPDKKRRTRDTPGTGIATGPVMQSALAAEGAVLVGWEWDYRDFVPRKMFEPHHRLDGTRVSTWSDPKLDTDPRNSWLGPSFSPGDHKGCACGSIPIMAVLDDPEGIVARRLAAAKGDPRRVAVDQLAAADDAAGRTGTSAQQTAEIRRRLTDAIDAMRAEHIEKPRPRRGRR